MVKKYIEGETKEQRKQRKALERLAKTNQELDLVDIPVEQNTLIKDQTTEAKRFVCCLKFGDKYGPEYVNNLYNMVQRNLTLDHEFVCFTENAEGLDPNIRIEELDLIAGVKGWWYKPMFFNPDISLKGTLLFLDLDMIIFRNMDKLFEYNPGEFCIIRDFNRTLIKDYNKFNSSIFRLETVHKQHKNVYVDFMKDPRAPISRYHGDQDWMRVCIQKDYTYWPEEWIQSYKWEMRGRPKYNRKPRGERDFETNGDPVIKDDTCIAVFHGDPNPHNCKDQWVIDNWK
jgi:hypothetical protein